MDSLGDGLSRLLRLGRPNAGRRRAELPDAMPAGSSSTTPHPHGFDSATSVELHLSRYHNWWDTQRRDNGAYAGTLPASELLAIHRELHRTETQDNEVNTK